MQRARRLVSIAVIAVLGIAALSGCRSQPGIAVYVGDRSYSQVDVDQVVNEIKDQVPTEQHGQLRRQVITMLVLRGAATDYADAHGISVPHTDPAAFADQHGLPTDGRYTELAASFSAAMDVIQQAAQSAAPSEADQREAHSHATVQGQQVTDPFEAVQEFFSEEQIGQAVGVRNLLTEVIGKADVSVNPRYGDLTYDVPVQIGQATSFLAVPLTDTKHTVSGAVVSRR